MTQAAGKEIEMLAGIIDLDLEFRKTNYTKDIAFATWSIDVLEYLL